MYQIPDMDAQFLSRENIDALTNKAIAKHVIHISS